VRIALAMLLLVLITGAASAQRTFDAKGPRYQCPPGDGPCSLPRPQRVPLQALPHQRRQQLPPYVPCGSRCDLLDRMK
jgi:hypothetical protein